MTNLTLVKEYQSKMKTFSGTDSSRSFPHMKIEKQNTCIHKLLSDLQSSSNAKSKPIIIQ